MNIKKHGDFCVYYDTSQKRYYWVLGYFNNRVEDIYKVGKMFAEEYGVEFSSVHFDEVLYSSRFKHFKYITATEVMEYKHPAKQMENVWDWLTQ